MLKYLIILLDDTSVSYCHYPNTETQEFLIPIETLKKGLVFAMKENLDVQFVYPSKSLPLEYKPLIDCVEHTDIIPAECKQVAQIVVFDDCTKFKNCELHKDIAYVLRISTKQLFKDYKAIVNVLGNVSRINIVLTDIESMNDDDFKTYQDVLNDLSDSLFEYYVKGFYPQLNLISDRIILSNMNNCGAAVNTVTLAPNGKFYVCPAYYHENKDNHIGDLEHGLDIKNARLYKLEYALICSHCDAYQCRRCIWMNQRTTLEVNTPGREQCIVSHIERNASKRLLERLHLQGSFKQIAPIKEIDYLDPFEKRNEWE